MTSRLAHINCSCTFQMSFDRTSTTSAILAHSRCLLSEYKLHQLFFYIPDVFRAYIHQIDLKFFQTYINYIIYSFTISISFKFAYSHHSCASQSSFVLPIRTSTVQPRPKFVNEASKSSKQQRFAPFERFETKFETFSDKEF